MASHAYIDQLARRMVRSGSDASPGWMPRTPQVSLHLGTVTKVDTGNSVLDFQFADPSSGGVTVPRVRYLQTYSPSNDPAVGHLVWGLHYGTDLLVVGQHVVPNSSVVF